MKDSWLRGAPALDGNHVNLPALNSMLGGVMRGAIEHVFQLAHRDLLFGKKLFGRSQRFDFNEENDSAFLSDDVNFAVRRADVAPQRFVAVVCQPSDGFFFSPSADLLVMRRHGCYGGSALKCRASGRAARLFVFLRR